MISGIEIYRRTFMRQAIKYIYTKVAVDLAHLNGKLLVEA